MLLNDAIEVKLRLHFSSLVEEKNKTYSEKKCSKNIVYCFKNHEEYIEYFLKNGINDISIELLEMCKHKTTKRGTIIASKYLCDHIIKRYKLNKELTQSEIDEIHSRGKITPREIVQEWQALDCCIPGDTIGGAKERCKKFANCHECLLDYAYEKREYDKIKLEPVNIEISKIFQKSK